MEITFETYDNKEKDHLTAAAYLEEWSVQAQTMKPITAESIAAYPYGVLAFGSRQKLLGHVAITELDDGLAIVGGMVVNPYERGQGVATALLTHLMETAQQQLPDVTSVIAYANAQSSGLFTKLGSSAVCLQTLKPTGCNWVHDLTNAILTSDEK